MQKSDLENFTLRNVVILSSLSSSSTLYGCTISVTISERC